MTRVSLKELKSTVERFNSLIEDSNREVRVGQRYGYKALDLYYKDSGKMIRTLRAGFSTGEAQEYLFAMIKGMELGTLANKKKNLKEVV